jgi:hypothetical protein
MEMLKYPTVGQEAREVLQAGLRTLSSDFPSLDLRGIQSRPHSGMPKTSRAWFVVSHFVNLLDTGAPGCYTLKRASSSEATLR